MKNPTRSIFPFLFALLTLAAGAADFDWNPGEVSAVVKPSDKTNIGQYLYVSRPHQNLKGWTQAKLDLPESWKVKSVKIEGRKIQVVTEKSGKFEITPKNLRTLWTKLRKSKADTDLEKVWKAEAAAEEKKKKKAAKSG